MELDVLNPERVRLSLDEPTKKRVLEVITELCAEPEKQAEYFQALVDREKLGSTGLGLGVALPHARIKGLDQPTACFLQLKKPIQFESIDQKPVDLVFGLFVPEGENEDHLKILANIAGIFNQADVCEKLRNVHSASEAYDILNHAQGDAALAS